MNSISVSLNKLKYMDVNSSITKAVYVDGPDNFDEWFVMVKHIFPNLKKVICRDSGLTSLVCKGIKSLDCSNNKLSLLITDAKNVKCNNNMLTRINLPNSTIIRCNNNMLETIRCPLAKYLECKNNRLTNLYCPNSVCLIASNNPLDNAYCPVATMIEYTGDVKIHCPMVKLMFQM